MNRIIKNIKKLRDERHSWLYATRQSSTIIDTIHYGEVHTIVHSFNLLPDTTHHEWFITPPLNGMCARTIEVEVVQPDVHYTFLEVYCADEHQWYIKAVK